jgi:hypothetical protein
VPHVDLADTRRAALRAILSKLSSLSSFPADQYKVLTSKFRQLGLFSDEQVDQRGSPMKALAALLEKKCQFEEGEVDIVLLQHTFEIERADGKMVRTLPGFL